MKHKSLKQIREEVREINLQFKKRYKEAKAAILLYPSNDISQHKHDYLQSWYLEDDKEKKIRIYSIDISDEYNTITQLKNMIEKNLSK